MRAFLSFLAVWFLTELCLSMTWAEDGAQSAAVSSRIVEKRSFRDIPVVIVRPKEFSPGTRLVVLYHGFGPPQSPQALAEALPLEKLPAVLAYVNLPSVAGRVAAGGIDELKRVQANDFVNGLFFPCLKDAADELPMLVHDIVSSYHLDVRDGIGLFGFSAGGAAALFVLIRSDVPVAAAAILNAPLSVEDNVKNWEHALKRRFQWDDASRAAAESYNVERHAGTITQRKPIPALLLLHGESDDSFDPASVQRTIDALRAAYRQANAEDKFAVKVLAGVGHNFGPDAGKSPETKQATDEINLKVENWFEKLLISR